MTSCASVCGTGVPVHAGGGGTALPEPGGALQLPHSTRIERRSKPAFTSAPLIYDKLKAIIASGAAFSANETSSWYSARSPRLSRANHMHSDAASQGGGWWQCCGVAYGKAIGCVVSADRARSSSTKNQRSAVAPGRITRHDSAK